MVTNHKWSLPAMDVSAERQGMGVRVRDDGRREREGKRKGGDIRDGGKMVLSLGLG